MKKECTMKLSALMIPEFDQEMKTARKTLERLCTRNVSRALIERPYSREPQAVGAVYDRPGFFVQSRGNRDAGRESTPDSRTSRSCSAARPRLPHSSGAAGSAHPLAYRGWDRHGIRARALRQWIFAHHRDSNCERPVGIPMVWHE